MPWGVAAAGIGLIGSKMGADASADAAAAQQQAGMQGLQASAAAAARAQKVQQPYRIAGKNTLNELMYQMGIGDPTGYAETQDYFDEGKFKDFALSEAEKKIRAERAGAKNVAKTDQLVSKRLAQLGKKIDTEGAWSVYQNRLNSGGKVNGDFFMKRDATGGGGANNGYGNLLRDFTNEDFVKDPGYNFRMAEGAKQVEGSAAARGGLLSGAAMKAMERYGQGFASNEFANAYNRDTANKSNRFNRLSNIVDTGARAAAITGQSAQNQGVQAAQQFSTMGDARASGIMGANNQRASGYGQVGNMMMDQWASNKADSGGGGGSWNWGSNNGAPASASTSLKWNPQTQSYE